MFFPGFPPGFPELPLNLLRTRHYSLSSTVSILTLYPSSTHPEKLEYRKASLLISCSGSGVLLCDFISERSNSLSVSSAKSMHAQIKRAPSWAIKSQQQHKPGIPVFKRIGTDAIQSQSQLPPIDQRCVGDTPCTTDENSCTAEYQPGL